MTDAKNHHYVPQFYLSKFAFDSKRIWVFDKSIQATFPASIKRLSSETSFYDMPQVELDEEAAEKLAYYGKMGGFDAISPHFVEEFLAKHETIYGRVLNEVLVKCELKQSISEDDQYCLAHFIMMQLLRTVEAREKIKQIEEIGFNFLFEEKFQLSQNNLRLVVNDEHLKLQHIASMFDPELQERLMTALLQHIWMIGVNTSDEHLYTSDHPVVQKGMDNQAVGVGSFGIQISLPLSPKFCLMLCYRKAFSLLGHLHLSYTELNKDNVQHYNSLQTLQSNRQVYSDINNFEVAQNVCSGHPEINNPKRVRIIAETLRPMNNSQRRRLNKKGVSRKQGR